MTKNVEQNEPDDADHGTDTTSDIQLTSTKHNGSSTEISTLLGNNKSEYEEVNNNVSNHDDPTIPCLTFRSITLGVFFTVVFSFVNQFFLFRTIPMTLTMPIAQLLSYPMGKAMAAVLPHRRFTLFGEKFSFTFNPSPFSIKEHCVIATMANVASGTANAIHVLAIQRLFFHRSINNFLGLLFVISSQTLGYGMAGIMRRFLVWPGAMIWPSTLADCALFRALHRIDDDDDNDAGNDKNKSHALRKLNQPMSRFRFFLLILLFQFLWYWIPGYLCPILSTFSLLCLINPSNIVLSQLTGYNALGLGSITFDWNSIISFLSSPITVPLWAQVNMMVGFVVSIWLIIPLFYYLNVWNSQSMPILSNRLFTKEGYYYDTNAILDSNAQLNETAYQIQGEIRLSAGFAVLYGLGFAGITCVLVHTILFHGKTIVDRFRSSLSSVNDDIHAKLMAQYKEAPEWWYTIVFILAFLMAAIACHYGQLMPFYMLFIAIIIPFVFILPTGIVAAVSNQGIGLNIFTEFIAGLILPGNPIGNVTFKTYGYISQTQAITFLSDLKFGHYMKIPPRVMFSIQILATLISGIINYYTAIHLLTTIPNICTPKNVDWRCPGTVTFYSASIIWGLIGPIKMFGSKSIYSSTLYCFLLGIILPIPAWILHRKYPNIKWLGYIHFPLIFSSVSMIPPAPTGEYPTWFAIGFLFNFILFRYTHGWWKRYAFIFSAAMTCGVAIGTFTIFFVLKNNNIFLPNWWGIGGPTGDGCPLGAANISGIFPSYET